MTTADLAAIKLRNVRYREYAWTAMAWQDVVALVAEVESCWTRLAILEKPQEKVADAREKGKGA